MQLGFLVVGEMKIPRETNVLQKSWLYSIVEPSIKFCSKSMLVPLLSWHIIKNVHSDIAVHNSLFFVKERCWWFCGLL